MKNKTKNTKNVQSKKNINKITIDAKKKTKNQIKDTPKEEEWMKIQWLLCINSNHFPDIRFIFKQFQLFLFVTCCNSYYTIFPLRLYTKAIEKANKIHYCSYLKTHNLETTKRYCATCDKWICQKCEQRHFKLCRKAFYSNIELPDKGIEKMEKEREDDLTRKVNSFIDECKEIIKYHQNIKNAIIEALNKKGNNDTLIKKINTTYKKHDKINQDILSIVYLLLVNYKNYPIYSDNLIYTFARIKVEEVLFTNIIDYEKIEEQANDYIKYISSYFIIKNQIVDLHEGTINNLISDNCSYMIKNSCLIIEKKDIVQYYKKYFRPENSYNKTEGIPINFEAIDSNRIFFSRNSSLYLLNLTKAEEPKNVYTFNNVIAEIKKRNNKEMLVRLDKQSIIAIYNIEFNQTVSYITVSITITTMLPLLNGNILLSGYEGKTEMLEYEQKNNVIAIIKGDSLNMIEKHPMQCHFTKIIECQRGNIIVGINSRVFNNCLCFIETKNYSILKSEDESNDTMDIALLSNSTVIVNQDGYISLYDEYSFNLIYSYDGRAEENDDEDYQNKRTPFYVYDEYNSALLNNMFILDTRMKGENIMINEGLYYLDINY